MASAIRDGFGSPVLPGPYEIRADASGPVVAEARERSRQAVDLGAGRRGSDDPHCSRREGLLEPDQSRFSQTSRLENRVEPGIIDQIDAPVEAVYAGEVYKKDLPSWSSNLLQQPRQGGVFDRALAQNLFHIGEGKRRYGQRGERRGKKRPP